MLVDQQMLRVSHLLPVLNPLPLMVYSQAESESEEESGGEDGVEVAFDDGASASLAVAGEDGQPQEEEKEESDFEIDDI